MAKDRASIFGEDEPPALDIAAFKPKVKAKRSAPDPKTVRAVSEAERRPPIPTIRPRSINTLPRRRRAAVS